MRIRTLRGMMPMGIIVLAVVVSGCASPRPKPRASRAPVRPIQIRTVTHKPSWLLVGCVDVDSSIGGDRMRVYPSLTGIGAFDIVGTDKDDPVTVTFFSGGRIVYWKGKGTITKRSVGERVVVPLVNTD